MEVLCLKFNSVYYPTFQVEILIHSLIMNQYLYLADYLNLFVFLHLAY